MYYCIKVFFPLKLRLFHLNLLLNVVVNLFLVLLAFVLETLLLSIYTILPNRSYLILFLTFQLNVNVTLFAYLSYRLKPSLNVNIAPVSVCQRVNVVRSVLCHPHVSFLAKPLFTTVNLVRPVIASNVKSVNSAHHIRRMFLSMQCTTSIHQRFSYRRHENGTSFPLPSLNVISSPGIKSHLSPLTSKLNLLPRPSSPPGTSSPPNFQHVSSSIKICLLLMVLFNVVSLNQPTQYILAFNI